MCEDCVTIRNEVAALTAELESLEAEAKGVARERDAARAEAASLREQLAGQREAVLREALALCHREAEVNWDDDSEGHHGVMAVARLLEVRLERLASAPPPAPEAPATTCGTCEHPVHDGLCGEDVPRPPMSCPCANAAKFRTGHAPGGGE